MNDDRPKRKNKNLSQKEIEKKKKKVREKKKNCFRREESRQTWRVSWAELSEMIGRLVLSRQTIVLSTLHDVMIAQPALVTVVVQTVLVSTELLRFVVAFAAFGVLQVGIDLNL